MVEQDPELSRAYCEAEHPEPSAALDARILGAARQAVKVAPRRRPGWFGWAIPMSTTAVLVLGVSLLFRMQHEAPETLREAAPPPALPASPASPVSQTAPATALPMSTTPPTTPSQASRAAKPAPQLSDTSPAVPPEVAREAPAAAPQSAESKPFPAQADQARAAAPAPAANDLGTARMERAPAQELAPAFSSGMSQRKAASPVDDGPEQRVEKIRRLLSQGRLEEARKTLDELRGRYPAFVLPADLSEGRCCLPPHSKAE